MKKYNIMMPYWCYITDKFVCYGQLITGFSCEWYISILIIKSNNFEDFILILFSIKR